MTDTDDFERALAVLRKRFPQAANVVPYFPAVGRGLLPPDWTRPALILPLDGHYVVQDPPAQPSVSWLAEAFAQRQEDFLRVLGEVRVGLDRGQFPNHDIDGVTPYFPNSFFGVMDATALTGMIGSLKPQRYIEIGSGISTRFARRAIQQFGLTTRVTCIDPAPRKPIDRIADEIISVGLLDADVSIFQSLSANDILFFDGSHLSFSGTDCPRFFLEILPRLRAGVYVHIHDIFLPDDYPDRLKTRFYNEQHLLAAFLYNNAQFEVVLPLQYLYRQGHCSEGVSFWIKCTYEAPS